VLGSVPIDPAAVDPVRFDAGTADAGASADRRLIT
jgi:hypothetical protein